MLILLLFTSLVVQSTKPVTPAPTPQPAGGAPTHVVYLPPDAAALIVKISAASESGRLCQDQLTEARERALTLERREIELKSEQADVVKERDTSADTIRRTPANSAENVAARNQNLAARTKWQTLQTQIGNTLQDQQRVKSEITNHLGCIQASQTVLKGLFSAQSSATK